MILVVDYITHQVKMLVMVTVDVMPILVLIMKDNQMVVFQLQVQLITQEL